MQHILIFSVLLCSLPFISYANLSKLRTYPSGISVSFEAPEEIEKKEEKKKKRWGRKKRKEQEQIVTLPTMKTFSKFIRLINSIKIDDEYSISLSFYNKEDKLISQKIITNTTKPSANYMFFIDRNSGRKFQGFLDIYNIPQNTVYFKTGIYDKDQNIITTATHPDFNTDNKILLSEYNKLSPTLSIMLQIELLGSEQNILTRIGAFYFTK